MKPGEHPPVEQSHESERNAVAILELVGRWCDGRHRSDIDAADTFQCIVHDARLDLELMIVMQVLDGAATTACVMRARRRPSAGTCGNDFEQPSGSPALLFARHFNQCLVSGRSALHENGAA